ncbi:uncharacterized protein A1O9_00754 [Exophiala aquamarina CBS 119918]|uniref:Ubiquitin-like domain-containing protein n=1 Tax=Exophiala aquamarina CBS 119918 TaxID=1182545 RepID=A0A072PSG7_9EURO|nr:uncharacterized protein A1O9_00754 [Exophiala aquamarina CBS 119918]KEF62781.1 hypothetical protein A1O9_00754 [Exophiala aquamarina CBS 119918]
MASGVKRSLFTKPAWAAAAPAGSEKPSMGDDTVFGRNTVYEDILMAEQKRQERRQEKARERALRRKDEGRDSKRRRVSTEQEAVADDTDILSDSDNLETSSSCASEKPQSPIVEDHPVTRSTPNKDKRLQIGLDEVEGSLKSSRRRDLATKKKDKEKTLVDISSDGQAEDDELIMLTPAKSKARRTSLSKLKAQLDDYESEEEDEFLQELKQKAREKARLQKLGLSDRDRPSALPATTATLPKSALTAPVPPRASSAEQNRPRSSNSNADLQNETSVSRKQRGKEKADDPEVKILITSTIPDTNALIVKRKASQPLRQVREFWCQRNNLDAKTTAQIFFTWRGTRLFDSTTMRGPIQKLKNDHAAKQRMVYDDYNVDDDDDEHDGDSDVERNVEDPSQGRITLEAMTQEIFDERQLEKERKALASGDQDGHENENESDDAYYKEQEATREQAQREAEEKMKGTIVVRLVSQTMDAMNLRVRPHTSVGKMMQGFAATKRLEEGKTAWLIFDGERLEPQSTVEDLGLEDEDEIEVHIR